MTLRLASSHTSAGHLAARLLAAAALVAMGCALGALIEGSAEAAVGRPQETLAYEIRTYESTSGECDNERGGWCTRLAFIWPEVVAAPTPQSMRAINDSIRDWVERAEYQDDRSTPDEFAKAFQRGHDDLRAEFPEYTLPWWVERTVTVVRHSSGVFAVSMFEDMFTGGAHGSHVLLYSNYRPHSGDVIALDDILVDGAIEELTAVAEGIFRQQMELAPDTPLGEAGFWFDDDVFAVNDNFLIGDDGLLFHYIEYEIAAYARGATELLVPYALVSHLLRPDAAIR